MQVAAAAELNVPVLDSDGDGLMDLMVMACGYIGGVEKHLV